MRKSRFTESQIVGILKEGEAGIPLAEFVRTHGIDVTPVIGPVVMREPSVLAALPMGPA